MQKKGHIIRDREYIVRDRKGVMEGGINILKICLKKILKKGYFIRDRKGVMEGGMDKGWER